MGTSAGLENHNNKLSLYIFRNVIHFVHAGAYLSEVVCARAQKNVNHILVIHISHGNVADGERFRAVILWNRKKSKFHGYNLQ